MVVVGVVVDVTVVVDVAVEVDVAVVVDVEAEAEGVQSSNLHLDFFCIHV